MHVSTNSQTKRSLNFQTRNRQIGCRLGSEQQNIKNWTTAKGIRCFFAQEGRLRPNSPACHCKILQALLKRSVHSRVAEAKEQRERGGDLQAALREQSSRGAGEDAAAGAGRESRRAQQDQARLPQRRVQSERAQARPDSDQARAEPRQGSFARYFSPLQIFFRSDFQNHKTFLRLEHDCLKRGST